MRNFILGIALSIALSVNLAFGDGVICGKIVKYDLYHQPLYMVTLDNGSTVRTSDPSQILPLMAGDLEVCFAPSRSDNRFDELVSVSKLKSFAQDPNPPAPSPVPCSDQFPPDRQSGVDAQRNCLPDAIKSYDQVSEHIFQTAMAHPGLILRGEYEAARRAQEFLGLDCWRFQARWLPFKCEVQGRRKALDTDKLFERCRNVSGGYCRAAAGS